MYNFVRRIHCDNNTRTSANDRRTHLVSFLLPVAAAVGRTVGRLLVLRHRLGFDLETVLEFVEVDLDILALLADALPDVVAAGGDLLLGDLAPLQLAHLHLRLGRHLLR